MSSASGSVSKEDKVQIKQGDHICSIYKDKEQQFSRLIPFFLDGLNNHEKCVYVADDNSQDDVLQEFRKAGIDVSKFLSSKQFQILSVGETYLSGGSFEPKKMIDFIKQAETNALQEGYSGLRGTGEMTWVLGDLPSLKQLIDYEELINNALSWSKTTLVCQYNENKFSPEILINIIRSHPYTIIYGKIYENKYLYSPPENLENSQNLLPADSYRTVIDIVTEK